MKESWHTKRWYNENFGVDVTKLSIMPKEVKNPHYRSAPPMKLWKENDILPFKNDKKIQRFKKRSEAGKRAFKTRKNNLIDFFEDVQSSNPRVNEITKRLWEIGKEIGKLHHLKEECRDADDYDGREHYFDYGREHCSKCRQMSEKQDKLRRERYGLFEDLELICGMDKRTIQLSRRYRRECLNHKELKDEDEKKKEELADIIAAIVHDDGIKSN